MKDKISYSKVYECLDDSCKFVIDSAISTIERDTKEMPLTRKHIELKNITQIGEDEVEGFISTRDLDWSGDIVIPEGVILDVYQKNPSVFFNHDSTKIIGKCVSLMVEEYGIKAKMQFADTDEAKDCMKLAKGGFLNTFSIGFLPVSFVKKTEKSFKMENEALKEKYPEYNGGANRIIKEWVLLEFSLVGTPDNPNAIITSKQIQDMEIKSSTIEMLNIKCSDCESSSKEFKEALDEKKLVNQKEYEKEEYADKFDKKRTKYENILKKSTEELFKAEQRKIKELTNIETLYKDIESVVNKNKPKFKNTLLPFYITVVEEFGQETLSQFNDKQNKAKQDEEEFDVTDAMMIYLTAKATESSLYITDTTKKKLKDIVDKGITEGKSIEEIKEEIDVIYNEQFIKNRAALIAAVEVVSASNYGSITGAEQTESEVKKIWIPILDNKTRETHAIAGGHPPVALDEPFNVGGYEMQYPADSSGPPEEVVNCRCVLGYTSDKKSINKEITIIKTKEDKEIDRTIQVKKQALYKELKDIESKYTKRGKLVRY